MEFKINKNTLLSGLYLAQGISDRKSTGKVACEW